MQTCVTVNNIDATKTRLDHVFNLLGYFGNVARIKALAQKNIILVDFATPEEAHNAMRFIKAGLTLLGQQVR